MALTEAEKLELAQLEQELGGRSSGLTDAERAELAALESEFGGEKKSGGKGVQAFLEHAGNALTLGYAPQLQAMASGPIYSALNAITGSDVQPDDYVSERDSNVKRLGNLQQSNPGSAMAGSLAGSLVGSSLIPVPGAGLSGGLWSAAGKAAGYGAAQGALANPGDEEGVVDPLQLQARLKNAATGAAVGGVASGVSSGVKAVARGKLSEALKKLAETKAFKSSGAMLKDFRNANARGEVRDIGRFMLDNGLVKAGDSVDDVARKAAGMVDDAGNALDNIYAPVEGKLQDAAFMNRLTANELESIKSAGFNPVRDKVAILERAKEALGSSVDRKQSLQKLSNYLDDLAEEHGNKVLSPRASNDIKSAIDKSINYARNPLSPDPGFETALYSTRSALNEGIKKNIDNVGKLGGLGIDSNSLQKANRAYSMSKRVRDIANDRISREEANAMFGLRDTIAGSAGGAAGGILGGILSGGDMKDAGLMSLVGGALGAAGSKVSRKYGNQVTAKAADKAANLSRWAAEPVARGLVYINPQDVLTKAVIQDQATRQPVPASPWGY